MSATGGELGYIAWIRSRVSHRESTGIGIGDDAAVVRSPQGTDCLLTVDLLMDQAHFDSSAHSAEQIGRKALAVNLSDIAAMAGRPLYAVVAVALSRGAGSEFARSFFTGLERLADEFDVDVVGGDTNIWDGPLVVSVTVIGEPTGSGPVTRSGAKTGDWILTTGEFGGSLAGKHLDFQPRVREAIELHRSVCLHALIDVSDGLAADLWHILEESGVGAVLEADAISISDAAASAASDGKSPLQHALSDGEDFELLFTVGPQQGQELIDAQPLAVGLTKIGEIVEAAGCDLVDAAGHRTPLPRRGWEHQF